MSQDALRYGVVILARSEARLVRATLASVRALAYAPSRIAVAVTKAREHLTSELAEENADALYDLVITPDDETIAAGVSALAPHADVAVIVPQGVLLRLDYLDRLRDQAERFADRVAAIDLVREVVKIDADGEADASRHALKVRPREWPIVSALRGAVMARSLMGAIFWARIPALSQVKFGTTSDAGEALPFILALDRLQTRGRTEMRFTSAARSLRLAPERRSGFDLGYALYRRLAQLAESNRAASPSRGASPTHLDPRIERIRLFAAHSLRALVSPLSRRHATTFLKGALAARRDLRALRRTVQRDVRDML